MVQSRNKLYNYASNDANYEIYVQSICLNALYFDFYYGRVTVNNIRIKKKAKIIRLFSHLYPGDMYENILL